MKIIIFILCIISTTAQSKQVFNQQRENIEDISKQNLRRSPANSTVCYSNNIGCFSNNYPYNNSLNFLPVSPDLIKTEFLLFTNTNPKNGEFISYKNINTVQNSKFDPSLPLKILCHGFYNDLNTTWLYTLKDALLTNKVNVIITGWGNGATFPFYYNASSNIRVVGKEISLLINTIQKVFYPTSLSEFNIHCVGHSLGAHLCGYAGTFCKNDSNIYFDRISGMDPAGPLFENENQLVRLDPGDAKFVDIYHTNGGTLFTGSAGYLGALGHVDFYINDGKFQPGCPSIDNKVQDASCSHGRAIKIFTESIISTCDFIAFKCKDWNDFQNGECRSCENFECAKLGYFANRNQASDTMYIATFETEPFCGSFQYYFNLKINAKSPATSGQIILTIANESISITNLNFDIRKGIEIKKTFALSKNISNGQKVSIKFNKKNGLKPRRFIYEKIQLILLATNETLNNCQKISISDKETVNNELSSTVCVSCSRLNQYSNLIFSSIFIYLFKINAFY